MLELMKARTYHGISSPNGSVRYRSSRRGVAAAGYAGIATVDLTIDTVLVQDSELSPAAIDDRMVVLSVRAGACFSFNRIGDEIWSMLTTPCRVGDICDRLAELHHVDADVVIRDIGPFLQALIQRHLVRVVVPGSIT
jgi:hypothetical protein